MHGAKNISWTPDKEREKGRNWKKSKERIRKKKKKEKKTKKKRSGNEVGLKNVKKLKESTSLQTFVSSG